MKLLDHSNYSQTCLLLIINIIVKPKGPLIHSGYKNKKINKITKVNIELVEYFSIHFMYLLSNEFILHYYNVFITI